MNIRNAGDAMKMVRSAFDQSQMTTKMMSIRTGLSVSCIQNMMSGRTTWPRPTTLFNVMDVLGLEIEMKVVGDRAGARARRGSAEVRLAH